MKKEDLTNLGLTDEQIASIQKLNGLDIAKEQKKLEQAESDRDTYKTQLDTAQETLKGFENVDVNELQNKINTLTTELETNKTNHANELAERDFKQSLETSINSLGGKNAKAIMALLDVESLKGSKNQEADIKTALETCQKENSYLFGANEPINNPVGPTGRQVINNEDAQMVAMKAAMGIKED